MSLQRATTIALYGVGFLLIVSLANWVLFSFDLISYFDNARLFKILQLSIIFFQTVPLILFFFVFRKSHEKKNNQIIDQ